MTVPFSTHDHPQTDSLYERDYLCWLEATARLLREGKLSELDVVHLVEEIEDMGKREKRAVESNLEVILMHLLKYRYQPERRSNSWRFTILEHRDRLAKLYRDSPSLKPYAESIFADCYTLARRKATVETGLPPDTFPATSPFSLEDTINPDFLPES